MPGAGSVKAGKAYVEIYGENTKLVRMLKATETTLKSWGGKITGIGAAVFGAASALLTPLAAAAKVFSDMGSELIDMSGRTGASVEALSGLGYAADQTGSSLSELEGGLKKQAKFLAEAAQGGKAQQEVLQRLGLTVADLARMAPQDQFRAIAERLNGIPNPTARAATAMEIFGKSGSNLLPMIESLSELEDRATQLGIVMSTDDASAADTLGDAWGDLVAVGKTLVFQVGAALAPMLTSLTNAAVNIASSTIAWVKANREAIVTVVKILAIVAAVGAGLVALGGLIFGAGMAFGVLSTIVTAVGTAIGAAAAAFAFLISPIGLVLVALAGLTTWFFTMTSIGQQAIAFVVDAFMGLWKDATTAIGGISDALASGDWGAAMDIAGGFLKVQWKKIVVFLWDQYNNFLTMFLTGSLDVAKRVANAFISMAATIGEQLITTIELMNKLTGKNLVDPKKLDAVRFGLPFLKNGLSAKAERSIDSFGGDVRASGAAGAADARSDLDQARADFDRSVKAAADARRAFNLKKPKGPGDIEVPDLRDALNSAKTAVSGTFNASAAGGIGGAKQLDKIEVNTKQTARQIQKMNLQQKSGKFWQ